MKGLKIFFFTHRPNGVFIKKLYKTLNNKFNVSFLFNYNKNEVYIANFGINLSSILIIIKMIFNFIMNFKKSLFIVDIIDVGFFPYFINKKKYILLFSSPMHIELSWLGYPNFFIKFYEYMQKKAIKNSYLIIAYNDKMAIYCKKIGAENIIVIPNYPTKKFIVTKNKNKMLIENNLDKNLKYALFVGGGRMRKIYGLDLLLDSWELTITKLKNVQLLIIGPVDESFIYYYNDKKITKIKFIGLVSYKDLPNWINLSDVCLAPRTPGFPICWYDDKDSTKISEYAALGKPIVACGYANSTEYFLTKQNPIDFSNGIIAGLLGDIKPSTPHHWEESYSVIIDKVSNWVSDCDF